MAKDLLYTNGVIAATEKYLLKDRIFKLCEAGAEEAFRALTESGFGKGAEVSSVYEYERLVEADERATDEFIREYAPSRAELIYLLAARDFHNAKAAIKAKYAGADGEKMFAPEGLIPLAEILRCVEGREYEALGKHLGGTVRAAAELFENGQASGAEIGIIFEKAQYAYLSSACARHGLLKKLVAVKADMTNILTALRSDGAEYAEACYVDGGKLSHEKLSALFSEDAERAAHCLDGTPYSDFLHKCVEDRAAGLPLTRAERIFDSYETEYFAAKKYELQRNRPFLYYVFRRRAENSNVRILMACLLAGMNEQDIKKRLRTF